MAMAVDSQQRALPLGFDQVGPYNAQPQFTNPWASSQAAGNASHQLFANQVQAPNLGIDTTAKPPPVRANSMALSYSSVPAVPAPSATSATSSSFRYGQSDLSGLSQDMLSAGRMSNVSSLAPDSTYSTAPSPTNLAYAPTSAPYESVNYAQDKASPIAQQNERRLSQPVSAQSASFLGSPVDTQRPRHTSMMDFGRPLPSQPSRETFGDALDAGRGMVAMSQDITPRNIYGPRSARDSPDSYGFPATHSSSSSVSSINSYPSYYGSVDSAITDYSSASEAGLDIPSRTLPRPQGLLAGNLPPAPQSMMGQFSSKVSSSTQKKHKCKVCDKRFTRPSSLQTHMYSHTGEKPFCCEVEGCGRHFSVVSNLRRHRKVHKNDAKSDAGSEEHHDSD